MSYFALWVDKNFGWFDKNLIAKTLGETQNSKDLIAHIII